MSLKPKRDLKKLLKIVEKRKFPKLNPDQKLTLCMIAKNEGANIERCIESVESIVDEIVLVDTGSTDDTVEKAKKYGAKVFYYEWTNDFSAARNQAIKHATGDWILFLDPDEEIPDNCRDNLRAFLVDVGDDIFYQLRIKNLDAENKVKFENYMIRMFKNTPNAKYTGRIHEGVYPKNGFINISDDAVYILHHGYKNLEVVNKKIIERNLPILENIHSESINDSYKSYMNFYIGSSHFDLGETDKAIDYMKQSLDLSKNEPESEFTLSQYLRFMSIYFISRKIDELTELLKTAPERCKRLLNSHEYWYYYGASEFEKNNYNEALKHFNKAVEVYENAGSDLFVLINDISTYYYSAYMIAQVYFRLNEKDKAKASLESFMDKIKGQSSFSDVLLNAVSLFYEMEDYDNSANTCLRILKNGTKNDTLVKTYLTNIYMKANKFDKVIKIQAEMHEPEKVKENWYAMAKNLEDEKLFVEVEKVYTEILEVLPDETLAYLGRGVSRLIQNKTVDALSDLALCRKYAKDISDKKKLAMIYSQISQLNQAKSLLEEVLKENGDDYESNLYFANIEHSENQVEKAENRLLALMDKHQDDPRASVQLGNMYLASGFIEKAKDVFERATEKIKDNAYLFYALSLVYMDLENKNKALENIEKAIEIDPVDEGLQEIKKAIQSK
ncbi:MAG: tetratricopeptide repeat protein [Candidatus Sericytochromatia bacterium]